jgi:hypothetical protein
MIGSTFFRLVTITDEFGSVPEVGWRPSPTYQATFAQAPFAGVSGPVSIRRQQLQQTRICGQQWFPCDPV